MGMAIDIEVAMVFAGFFAESALADFGVEGGKEEVLQDGAIVVVAVFVVKAGEEFSDLFLAEEVIVDESLFLDKPDEEQSGDEANGLLLRGDGFFVGIGEFGRFDGVDKPFKEFGVEALVKRFRCPAR